MPQGCSWDGVHECLAGESLLIIIRWNYQADATQAWEFHTPLSCWIPWDLSALCKRLIRRDILYDTLMFQDCIMWQSNIILYLKYSRSAQKTFELKRDLLFSWKGTCSQSLEWFCHSVDAIHFQLDVGCIHIVSRLWFVSYIDLFLFCTKHSCHSTRVFKSSTWSETFHLSARCYKKYVFILVLKLISYRVSLVVVRQQVLVFFYALMALKLTNTV